MVVAVAAAVLALTGCGAQDSRTGTPAGSDDGSTAAAERPARKAPTARAVVAALTKLDTGRTSTVLEVDGTTITRTGRYRVSDLAGATDITYDLGDTGTLNIRTLAVNGVAFAQVDNGDELRMRRCWWRYEAGVVAEAVGGGEPGMLGLSPEINALLDLQDERGRTTSDLYTVASILGAKFPTSLGVSVESDSRTPIDLHFDDGGVLTGWSTSIARLAGSAQDAGLTPSPGLALLGTPIDVELDGFGDAIDIDAPAEDRQVLFDTSSSEDRLDADISACEAG